jgi:TP901-1 family phage major tail protein
MTAQAAKDCIIRLKNGVGVYEAVAGMRTKTFDLNSEAVDITNSDSAGMWREILSGAGVKSATIGGGGVFVNGNAEKRMIALAMSGAVEDAQIFFPELGTFEAPFKVTAVKLGGEYNREETYEFTFESGGEVVFDAV